MRGNLNICFAKRLYLSIEYSLLNIGYYNLISDIVGHGTPCPYFSHIPHRTIRPYFPYTLYLTSRLVFSTHIHNPVNLFERVIKMWRKSYDTIAQRNMNSVFL